MALQRSYNVDDHTCSICFRLFMDPQTTPCHHTFCRRCAVRTMQRGKAQCPLCRGDLGSWLPEYQPVDVEYTAFLQQCFPVLYSERAQEESDEALEERFTVRRRIRIGNYHELLDSAMGHNRHKWRFFVHDEEEGGNLAEIIQKVAVDLHPTFYPPRIDLWRPPFEFTRIGWGVFELRVHIFFHPALGKDPMEFSHMLTFTGDGGYMVHTIEYDHRKFDAMRGSQQLMQMAT